MLDQLMRRALQALAFAALLALSSQSGAAVYLFTLSGNATASFSLNSSPIPANSFATSFTVTSVPCTVNGSSTTCNMEFFTSADDGGLDIDGNGFLSLAGSQLFTGTTTTPTFLLGTFPLSTFGSDDHLYSLTISGGVPEPATWAMLVLGFAGIGLVVRRRSASIA